MNHKQHWAGLAVLVCLALAACSGTPVGPPAAGEESAAQVEQDTATAGSGDEWDEGSATIIALSDDGIAVDGDGAAADGGTLTISSGGSYILSGSLSAGQVVVDADKDDTVRLVLDGVSITAGDNAGIYNPGAGTLILMLADGSENSIADAADFVYADAEAEEPDAAIFSKNNLTIEGTGSLTVNAGYNNGIGAKDDLLITGGALNVTAANHGIRGRDSLTVTDGIITVSAGNDGLQANNANSEDVGRITLSGGTFAITAGHDGIQAESSLTISGGDYTVTTGGGAAADMTTTEQSSSDSYKGLKATTSIVITGGSFSIDSADDAIHCNGDIRIDDGVFELMTGDDGIHADNDLTINDGTIHIPASYEGIEAFTMTIAGGTINVVSNDDGNVAGGTDTNGGGRRGGADTFALNGDRWLKITGGHITIDSGGDGIDINGDGEMTGGEVYITSSVNGPDSALDYDGNFVMTGGVMIGSGSSAMAMAPGSDSTQPSLMIYYTDVQAAGTTFSLADAQGNTIASLTPARDYQNLLITTPDLMDGANYTVLADGETLLEVTLSGAATRLRDTGEEVSGGMGGFGGMGGRGGGMGADGQPPDGGAPGDWPGGPRGGDRPAPEGGPEGNRPGAGEQVSQSAA